MKKPVYLTREGMWPHTVTRAVLRDDGVHFIDRDGRERQHAEYPSIEAMNQTLRGLHFAEFRIDVAKPQE